MKEKQQAQSNKLRHFVAGQFGKLTQSQASSVKLRHLVLFHKPGTKIKTGSGGKYNDNKNNLQIVGGLSKPSKMPGWAYGLPAPECKTGSKLRDIPNSTCSGCYAMKGCYVFPVVQAAQYRRLASIKSIEWVDAMAELINSKNQNILDGMTQATYRTKHTS